MSMSIGRGMKVFSSDDFYTMQRFKPPFKGNRISLRLLNLIFSLFAPNIHVDHLQEWFFDPRGANAYGDKIKSALHYFEKAFTT